MDKPQKELIKTYYRARTLADEQNDAMYGYNKYEIIPYAFDNGLITVEDNEEYAANLIVHNPELIKYFVDSGTLMLTAINRSPKMMNLKFPL